MSVISKESIWEKWRSEAISFTESALGAMEEYASQFKAQPPYNTGKGDGAKELACDFMWENKRPDINDGYQAVRKLFDEWLSQNSYHQNKLSAPNTGKGVWVQVSYPTHDKVVLTRTNGDTYTSKGEELLDFFLAPETSSPISVGAKTEQGIEAVEFALWIADKGYLPQYDNEPRWVMTDDFDQHTTTELYNIFKQNP